MPLKFWYAHGFYAVHGALFSIVWAEPFGEEDVNNMIDRYH